ncbi:MAG: hypothetical protein AABZ08_01510 [Planctomycetota bacterium]
MISTEFNLDAFIRDETAFARVVPAGDLFTRLTRQIVVPPSCAALVWGEAAQPSFFAGGRPIEAAGARDVLIVKAMPIQLEYEVSPLPSRDGFDYSASLRIAVQVVPDRTELEQLRRSLLGSRNRADAGDVRTHLDETIRRALSAFTKQHEAASLASPEHWRTFETVLSEQFQPIGFSSGLALESDIRVTFASTAYADRQRDQAVVTRREQQLAEESKLRTASAEARRLHLNELAALIERVQTATKAAPGTSVADVIRSFDVSRRGELYRGLMSLGTTVRRTESILIVAGQELLWFASNGGGNPTHRAALPMTLGPLRSVRLGEHEGRRIILVGARQGVFVMTVDAPEAATPYAFTPLADLRGGVNSTAIHNGRLYATHSEAGLLGWPFGEPDAPNYCLEDMLRGAKAVRDVQATDDGRLWFTIDSRVCAWCPDSKEAPLLFTAPAVIHSLLVTDTHVFTGLDNGAILRWDKQSPSMHDELQSPGGDAVHSLAFLSGGGIPRLLSADKRPHLTLRVLGDTYHAEYRCKQPLRWGVAEEDVIVGVNDLRDQLILWRPDVPEEPLATIAVARTCGHTVQDVILAGAPTSVVTC